MTGDRVRLDNGHGPEVDRPEWADRTPTPAQWVDWYLAQSREAQEWVASWHLDIEGRFAKVRQALEGLD